MHRMTEQQASGIAAMAGVVRNIKRSGVSRRDVDKMYAETMELVYQGEGEEEGVGVDANQGTGQDEVAPETPVKENTTMTMPVRKTPPRDAKSSDPSPKKTRRDPGTASKGATHKHEDSVG